MSSILEILDATLAPQKERRVEAEAVLMNMPNVVQGCFSVIQESTATPEQKLAAAIFLKSVCRSRWTDITSSKETPLPEADKVYFMANVVELLYCNIYNKRLYLQILATIAKVVRSCEIKKSEWPAIYDQIRQLFANNTPQSNLTGLHLLKMIFEEANVSDKVDSILDAFHGTLANSIKAWGDINEMTLPLIDAISEFVSTDILGVYNETYTICIPFLLKILSMADLSTKEGEDIIVAGAKCLHFECVKYIKSQKGRMAPFVVELCELFINLLRKVGVYTREKKRLTDALIETLVRFFDTSSDEPGLVSIQPHIEFILTQMIFPSLCYDEVDVQLWQDDPIEASRAIKDQSYLFDTSDTFLVQLTSKRPETVEGILTFLVERLNSIKQGGVDALQASMGQSGGLDSQKDGCLRMLGVIAEMTVKLHPSSIEELITNHIAEGLESLSPFIRLRAMYTIHGLLSYEAKLSEELLKKLFLGVARGLQDHSLPVRSQSALTLQPFWQLVMQGHDGVTNPDLRDFMKDHHASIMESMFNIANEDGMVDNYDVMESISDLVLAFTEEIVPFAVPAINALMCKVKTLSAASSVDHECYINTLFSVSSSFDAVNSILFAIHSSGSDTMFAEADNIIYEVTKEMMALSMDSGDMKEEVITLYTRYPRLTENMLSFIPQILECASVGSAVYCIKYFANIVSTGKQMLESREVQFSQQKVPLLKVIYEIVETNFADYDDGDDKADDYMGVMDETSAVYGTWDMVSILLECQSDVPLGPRMLEFYDSVSTQLIKQIEVVITKFHLYGSPNMRENADSADFVDNLVLDGTFLVRTWAVMFLTSPERFIEKMGGFTTSFAVVRDLVLSHSVRTMIACKTYLIAALKALSFGREYNVQDILKHQDELIDSVLLIFEEIGKCASICIERYTNDDWDEEIMSPYEYEWDAVDPVYSPIRSLDEFALLEKYISEGFLDSIKDKLFESVGPLKEKVLKVKQLEA